MSWAELVDGGSASLRASPLETDRFGVGVDRLTVPRGSSTEAGEILELIGSSTADVVVMRYPADRVELFARLVAGGRRTVLLADTLVYWRLAVGAGARPEPDPELDVAPRDLDPATVRELVADMFAGYSNHYRANPLFDVARAPAGYQEWALRSATTAPPVVVSRHGAPIALATTDRTEDVVEIELAGVVAAEQGRGVYGHLLAGVEDLAARESHGAVVISTQGHNTGVQRAWARYRFEPVATFVTVHLVADSAR